jgi:DNA-binding MarR family transcriptional regulator/N-acetylglutamate synthase-like GNAT family acetyltransferase
MPILGPAAHAGAMVDQSNDSIDYAHMPAPFDRRVDAVRRFNRFYTGRVGVLAPRLLGSRYSPAEARLVYELAQRDTPTAAELARELGLDRGYLSRLLKRLTEIGLVERQTSPEDARQSLLRLTRPGYMAYAELNRRATEATRTTLKRLPEAEQERLVQAMAAIERLVGGETAREAYLIRPPRAGEVTLTAARQAALYAAEYGWDARFEVLVARIAADFLEQFDPARERCWIAERHGEVVGSIYVVQQARTVAKLRMLYVEPGARGLGIGRRLVEEALAFARERNYRKVVLWTHDVLVAARRLYRDLGFAKAGTETHEDFGVPVVAETWELPLPGAPHARSGKR